MATNRKRTPRSRQVSALTPGEIDWLNDTGKWTGRFFLTTAELAALWAENSGDVLQRWIHDRPCTRPSNWWRFGVPERLQEGESQAAYLKRHDLLTKEEKAHLKEHPELLETEAWHLDQKARSTAITSPIRSTAGGH